VDKPFATHCYKILVGEMHIEPPLPILSGTSKISTRDGIEEREYLEGKGKSFRQSQP
jgi:hypothetical protein